jgi:hypothetical protein
VARQCPWEKFQVLKAVNHLDSKHRYTKQPEMSLSFSFHSQAQKLQCHPATELCFFISPYKLAADR